MAAPKKKPEAETEDESNLVTSQSEGRSVYGPAEPEAVVPVGQVGSTFAERAKARMAADKRVGGDESEAK